MVVDSGLLGACFFFFWIKSSVSEQKSKEGFTVWLKVKCVVKMEWGRERYNVG